MDRVKSSKLNLKMRRGRRRAGSRLEIFSLHSFLGFSSSPLFHLSVPRFCRLISPQPEVARQSGGGVYILYSLFHMREHVFKKKKKEKNKKSLLKINEAVWRQAMTDTDHRMRHQLFDSKRKRIKVCVCGFVVLTWRRRVTALYFSAPQSD